MPVAARSFLLIVVYLAVIAGQYFVASAVGHEVAFAANPGIVPEPTLLEHPVIRLVAATLSLGFLFGLLMGNPVVSGGRRSWFDVNRLGRYRACVALAGIIYLIVFFAFIGFPDRTAYGVLTLDLVLLIGIIVRIGWWATEGRNTSLSDTV